MAFAIGLPLQAQEATNVAAPQAWNWHVQNTDIVQGDPGFHAPYSGPNSLRSDGEIQESVSLDLYVGTRLWRGAEAYGDGLLWQGFGLSKTLGVEGFPNGEAFRVGTDIPNVNCARLFLRQTFGLGGEQETLEDGPLQLAGKQDVSRLTLTVGRFSAKDIFDSNAYANDARTQFLNWGLMANEAWDYPADSLGFTTGLAAELNQPNWALRYGFFQVPHTANGLAQDPHYLEAWGMVVEVERRFAFREHPGAVRLLSYLNRAHMGSFQEALNTPVRPADVEPTREYRYKYGFGLNIEQEVVTNLGAFLRLGWNDGQSESWMFADVDRTLSLGLSLSGAKWSRPQDTVAVAGLLNGISREHRDFFAAGGTGILAG
ncbi:MAG TPA: carbohydrate porin, partial [Candidatus Sulfotelmatobacter sp.]|nr:carbohydrate porin [Candidatus Sulfotelmatobacter sp.]